MAWIEHKAGLYRVRLRLPGGIVVTDSTASCQAATTTTHRSETATSIHEATTILHIAGDTARAKDTAPADADAAVIARTQLSTMIERLTDGTWHVPGPERLPDARRQDLALRDRIAADLEYL
jgi:hypothetical protein